MSWFLAYSSLHICIFDWLKAQDVTLTSKILSKEFEKEAFTRAVAPVLNISPHISHCRPDGLLGLGLGVCLLRAAGGGAGGRRGAAAVRHGGGRGVHRPLVPRHHGPALLHVSTQLLIDVL